MKQTLKDNIINIKNIIEDLRDDDSKEDDELIKACNEFLSLKPLETFDL